MICKAELHIADDGDVSYATMICGLERGHAGKHCERYPRRVEGELTTVDVEWHGDDRNAKS